MHNAYSNSFNIVIEILLLELLSNEEKERTIKAT